MNNISIGQRAKNKRLEKAPEVLMWLPTGVLHHWLQYLTLKLSLKLRHSHAQVKWSCFPVSFSSTCTSMRE